MPCLKYVLAFHGRRQLERRPETAYRAGLHALTHSLAEGMQRWLQRYLPPEVVASAIAVGCAPYTDTLINNDLLTVLISTWSSSAGYYGVLLTRELIYARQADRAPAVWITLRNLVLEFSAAELLDSVLFSPVLMYVCIQLVPNLQLAVALSELTSTAAFYTTVSVAHNLRKVVSPTGTYQREKT
jgi:hypothetical protein